MKPQKKHNEMVSSISPFIIAISIALPAAVLAQPCLTNTPGLVSLWAAEGDSHDCFGSNHGTTNGGVAFTSGRFGQGFQFDGTSGYVQVPDSPSLDLRSEATLMAWIALDRRPSEAGQSMVVVAKSQGGNDLDIQVEPDDRVRFYVGPGAADGSFVSSTTVLQTGLWYHVAATYRANDRVEIFMSGVHESTTPITVMRQVNTNPLTFGWSTVWGRFFQGRIDQVRVFDRALSEDTINDIFTAESGLVRARIYTAVEVCWSSATDAAYQVQWASSVVSTNWVNLGAPLQGTGTTICILDSTRNQQKRFYRVQVVP